MKKSEKIIKLKERMADTHFIRRGFALFIDFLLIALLSVPLYVGLFYFLSLFNPEYKKPLEDIKKIVSLESEDNALSPLGELILKKSEEELEKKNHPDK